MVIKEDCIFCKLANKIIPSDFIYENDNFVAFFDANPKIEGHTLIVPKSHSVNLMDMPESLGRELIEAIKSVGEIKLKEGFDGFNIIQNNFPAAGQVVMHSHLHILPRKEGDGFKIIA
ncbi:MAG TPA: HIT domain-containing protein [Candidatus Paceibacterota bacterium]|nr:HIT domain-containing protein [Candidatus Paceibacterota bacterium]